MALACSPVRGWKQLTNEELVREADAIVVATATGQTGADWDTTVQFRTDSVLKGPAPETFGASYAKLGEIEPSDPQELEEAHPEAYGGGCLRTTFTKDGQYVVFLSRLPDGTYGQLGEPFSRINEDYYGEDSPWVRLIRSYLQTPPDVPRL